MKHSIGTKGRFRVRSLSAAAAVVGGVGASFAAIHTARGSIVYSGVVDHTISLPGPGQQYSVDFDSTSPAEVRFFGDNVTQSKSGVDYLNIDTWNNGFMPVGKQEKGSTAYEVDALGAGTVINAGDGYAPTAPAALFQSSSPILGAWSAGESAYMGFQFTAPADGQTHYGWVNVVISADGTQGTIHNWAWESTPNTAITTGATPEPAAGSLLAIGLGTAGLRRRRRQR